MAAAEGVALERPGGIAGWSPAPCRWAPAEVWCDSVTRRTRRGRAGAGADEAEDPTRRRAPGAGGNYISRGLEPSLARKIADQVDGPQHALSAHARNRARHHRSSPGASRFRRALASASSLAVGAALPLAITAATPPQALIPVVAGTSLTFLALLKKVHGPHQRREHVRGHDPRHVLERARHRRDHSRREALRNGGS